MTPSPESRGTWLRDGWSAFTRAPKPLLGAFFVMTVPFGVSLFLNHELDPTSDSVLGFVLELLTLLAIPVFLVGWCNTCLSISGTECPDGRLSVFSGFRHLWKSLATGLLVIAAVLVGIGLLIVPGVVVIATLSFSPFATSDTASSPLQVMRQSLHVSKPHLRSLLGVAGVSLLAIVLTFLFSQAIYSLLLSEDTETRLILLGMAAVVGIASAVAASWSGCALASAYVKLFRATSASATPVTHQHAGSS